MNIFVSLYIIVDGYFAANFAGKTEFRTVNLIMPVLNILGTIGYISRKQIAREYQIIFVQAFQT